MSIFFFFFFLGDDGRGGDGVKGEGGSDDEEGEGNGVRSGSGSTLYLLPLPLPSRGASSSSSRLLPGNKPNSKIGVFCVCLFVCTIRRVVSCCLCYFFDFFVCVGADRKRNSGDFEPIFDVTMHHVSEDINIIYMGGV